MPEGSDSSSGSGNVSAPIPSVAPEDKRDFLDFLGGLYQHFKNSGTPGVGQAAPGNTGSAGGYEGGSPSGSGSAAPAAPPAPPAVNAGTTTIAAPPVPSDGPAPVQAQPPDAGMAGRALATLMQPRLGAGKPVGYSPADKELKAQLEAGRAQSETQARDFATTAQGNLDAFKSQAQALGDESQLALLAAKKEMADNAGHRKAIESESKERQGKIEAEIAAQMGQGVDPNRYWQNMSTPQKIGAGIAMALGAFGAHPLGPRGSSSTNYAQSIIDNAISADIDAQKTNMQKSLTLLGKKLDLEEHGFNRDIAMLAAERDSTMTAYTLTQNDISKRMAMAQGNADAQAKLTAQLQANQASADAWRDAFNEKIYALRKGSERVVGGGGVDMTKVTKRAQELRDTAAKGGKDLDPAEGLRQAFAETYGVDLAPGTPFGSIAAAPKGAGGALSARLVPRIADLNAAESAIKELSALSKKDLGALSLDDRARAATAADVLRRQGFTTIPEQPLTLGPTGTPAALASVLKEVRQRRTTLQTLGAGTGGGSEPEDFGMEKDSE